MIDWKQDTLARKPKVYTIAVLTAGFLALLTALFAIGGEKVLRFSCLLFAIYFLAVTVLLVRAFFLQIRYNLYSYNKIINFGFALFSASVVLTYALMFVNARNYPTESVLQNILGWLLGSAKTYTFFTFPFLFLFSAALVISNLSLIRHEGFRPVNLLGFLLAVLLLGGEGLIFGLDYYVSGSQTEVMLHDMFTNLLASVYLYFECMLLGTIVADAIAARYEPKKDKDYIIVLGCAIRKDGTPTPLLRGRLDRALTFAQTQLAETGKVPIFVLSGGRGTDECVSEAECMRRYLSAQGVQEEQMLLEDKSTDTAENGLLQEADPEPGPPRGKPSPGLLAGPGRSGGEDRLLHDELPCLPIRSQGTTGQNASPGHGMQIEVVFLAQRRRPGICRAFDSAPPEAGTDPARYDSVLCWPDSGVLHNVLANET